jgi:hypothetical protein
MTVALSELDGVSRKRYSLPMWNPLTTLPVIREFGVRPGLMSFCAKNPRRGSTTRPMTSSSTLHSRAPQARCPRISWVTLLGLAFAIGVSVLARSEDATRIGGKSASEWVAVFKSDDRKSRSDAFGALMLFVPAVREVVPALVDTLDDPRRDVQIKAVRALREIGPGAVAAAPALVRGLGFRGPEMSIAIEAKEALAAIGPAALPSLVPCLEKNMTLGSPAKSWRRSEPWAASVRRQTVPFPI